MKRIALVLLFALVVSAVFIPGCAGSKEIVIGFCGPLTGGSSFLGQTGQKSVQLAVDEINAAGGINGKTVKVIYENDQGTPADGLAAINKLIDQDKVVAIIGPYNSSVALAILDTIETKQVPILTTACNTKIVNQGKKYVFRPTLDNQVQGTALAKYVAEDLGLKKIAILFPNDDFGIELKDFFIQTSQTEPGVEIVSTQGYNGGTTDFYGILSGIKPLKPDAVILCGYVEDSAQIMRQAKELGTKTQFLGYGGLADDSLQKLAGDACEGCMMITTYEPSHPKNQIGIDFKAKYEAKYNEAANSYCGESYGAILCLFEAIKNAKTLDGPGIRDALARTHLECPLGMMGFDERGQATVPPTIAIIRNGERVLADKQPK